MPDADAGDLKTLALAAIAAGRAAVVLLSSATPASIVVARPDGVTLDAQARCCVSCWIGSAAAVEESRTWPRAAGSTRRPGRSSKPCGHWSGQPWGRALVSQVFAAVISNSPADGAREPPRR